MMGCVNPVATYSRTMCDSWTSPFPFPFFSSNDQINYTKPESECANARKTFRLHGNIHQ